MCLTRKAHLARLNNRFNKTEDAQSRTWSESEVNVIETQHMEKNDNDDVAQKKAGRHSR